MKIDTASVTQEWGNITTAIDKELDVAKPVTNEDMQKPVQVISGMRQEDFTDKDLNEKLKNDDMKKEFGKILDAANQIVFGTNSHFKFQVHEKTGATMVKLVDNNTNETIREFPPEKILNVMAGIWELAGILVDKKA